MGIFACCGSVLKSLSRAAARSAASRLRAVGALAVAAGWQRRAEVCARCPMCVTIAGRAYCGRPYLEQVRRDPAREGCGCPCVEKAKTPAEHCPIDRKGDPATTKYGHCTCKWCEENADRGHEGGSA